MADKKLPQVKCLYCGEHFFRQDVEYVAVKNRYAHKACHEKQEEYGHKKLSKPEESPEKTQEERDRLALIEFLLKTFHTQRLNPAVFMLMKKYKENYGFTYKGMLYALQYHLIINNNPVDKMNGSIGILPYIYNEAYDYYKAQEEKRDKIENVLQQSIINNAINTPIPIKPAKKAKTKLTPINIENL